MIDTASLRRRLEPAVVIQFVKYGLVGASNTIITTVTYAILVAVGVPYLLALILGYVPGTLNSYLLNRHWTFRAGHISHAHSGTRFAIVQVGAILANLALLYVLVHHAHVEKLVAQLILTVPVVLVTFVINRMWTFRDRDGHRLPRSSTAP